VRGATDAFVTKLSPDGSGLVYSTYVGGAANDYAVALAIDDASYAYVTGETDSADFPTTAGAYQRTVRGATDAFVTKLSPDGSGLVYSTYVGGGSL
jgi:hypothetical protein